MTENKTPHSTQSVIGDIMIKVAITFLHAEVDAVASLQGYKDPVKDIMFGLWWAGIPCPTTPPINTVIFAVNQGG